MIVYHKDWTCFLLRIGFSARLRSSLLICRIPSPLDHIKFYYKVSLITLCFISVFPLQLLPTTFIVSCVSGTFEWNRVCLQCPVGSYQPNIGSTQCTTCHASKVTAYPGATSPDQCIDAGMWLLHDKIAHFLFFTKILLALSNHLYQWLYQLMLYNDKFYILTKIKPSVFLVIYLFHLFYIIFIKMNSEYLSNLRICFVIYPLFEFFSPHSCVKYWFDVPGWNINKSHHKRSGRYWKTYSVLCNTSLWTEHC